LNANWWLRSPNTSGNVSNVNSTGQVNNNNNPGNSLALRPDLPHMPETTACAGRVRAGAKEPISFSEKTACRFSGKTQVGGWLDATCRALSCARFQLERRRTAF